MLRPYESQLRQDRPGVVIDVGSFAMEQKSKEPERRRRYENRGAACVLRPGGARAVAACCAPTKASCGKAGPGSSLTLALSRWSRNQKSRRDAGATKTGAPLAC